MCVIVDDKDRTWIVFHPGEVLILILPHVPEKCFRLTDEHHYTHTWTDASRLLCERNGETNSERGRAIAKNSRFVGGRSREKEVAAIKPAVVVESD